MTTLEALQGFVAAFERLEEQSCGCCVATVGDALAAWRSRTPLAGDEALVEAAAFGIYAELYSKNEAGLVKIAWDSERTKVHEEFRGYARAAFTAFDNVLDALLASPTETKENP